MKSRFEKSKVTYKDHDKETGKTSVALDGYTVLLDIFDMKIDVAFGQLDKINEVGEFDKYDYGFACSSSDRSGYFIWIHKKGDLNTIAHEVSHVVNFFHRHFKLPNEGAMEVEANIQGWLTEAIFNLK